MGLIILYIFVMNKTHKIMSQVNCNVARRLTIMQTLPKTFPNEFVDNLNNWERVFKSPYGNSYYNAKVNWGFKPNESLRISDHWNFRSQGKLHCESLNPCKNNTHWTIARFCAERNKYIVIKSIPKKGVEYTLTRAIEILILKKKKGSIRIDRQNLTARGYKRAKSNLELNILNSYFRALENIPT